MSSNIDQEELRRYLRRVSDRWLVEGAHVGGPRITGADDGADFVVVLVSQGFDGIPWLERVHQAERLWDAAEMGGAAEVHCYTPVEFERKRAQLAVVRHTADEGINLLA